MTCQKCGSPLGLSPITKKTGLQHSTCLKCGAKHELVIERGQMVSYKLTE